MKHKKVIIIGGGFGGMSVARKLGRDPHFEVQLVSDRPDFRYYPALYRSATGHTDLESSIPLHMMLFDMPRVEFTQASVTSVDPAAHTIATASGDVLHYDILVLALGVVTSFFNIPGMEQYSYGIKSIEDIAQLRKHLHDELVQTGHLDRDYVVVGAGPTGVELAAALISYIRSIAKMHHIQAKKVRLQLIEAAPRILPHSRKSAAKLVQERLKKLGVSITTGKMVQAASPTMLTVDDKELPTETVIWTAGVTNNPFFQANAAHFNFNKAHKVVVDDHLQAAPDIYVIGDNAATPYSGLAQTAVYDGGYVAGQLRRIVRGKKTKSYRARRPISVIPVGARWAVVEYGILVITGILGALLRRIADFVGYHDVMPFFMALTLMTASEKPHEDCPICRDE